MWNRVLLAAALILGGTGLSGCTTAVIAGAAAAGGYIAHEKGYRVRNPVYKVRHRAH